jgi:hypothetical protein
MSERPARISGRYMVNGRPAWCIENASGTVRVEYDGGAWTACNTETFARWNVEKIGAFPQGERT